MPKALIPGQHNQEPFATEAGHIFGDQNTMYTSWTLFKDRAQEFATQQGVVLTKRFKISEVTPSIFSNEYFDHDGEFLKLGATIADHVDYVKPKLPPKR